MNLRQALNQAVVQLLRPLVKVLLRHGVAYDEFAELARRTYVDVAERDFTLHGRKQTASRISVITGLNRKEVARLQALNSPEAHDAQGAAGAAGAAGEVGGRTRFEQSCAIWESNCSTASRFGSAMYFFKFSTSKTFASSPRPSFARAFAIQYIAATTAG